MRIVAIRHLPTLFNAEGLLQGRRDEPILPPTAAMKRVIGANRRRLLDMPVFDRVLVSRLRRTAMTAQAYGYSEQKEVEPLLDELAFGHFEGRPRSEMLAEVGSRWIEAPQTLVLGEPMEQLGERVRQLILKYRGLDSLLIFGHGAWIRALIAFAEHGGIESMNRNEIANNELTCITLGGAPL
ncbi:MAG: histidine phosphatase family protein [Chromatiaceae bacterium]|jgi:broad specificity phosphatase PhoE|nr:histidine phosphatase family protein [Chromatiaceae bacterium]